jgi:hypothetical protein
MLCEPELNPSCLQNDRELRLESNWFVQWCLRTIGANEEAVRERCQAPWIVLLWLGPTHWLRVMALVCSHSCPVPGKRPTTELSTLCAESVLQFQKRWRVAVSVHLQMEQSNSLDSSAISGLRRL